MIDSKGCKYIGEFMSDLPENVILNKVTTGSGMTSVVLENDVKYVLAVPFISLIKNKEGWCKEKGIEICAVYNGKNNEENIKEFSGRKIIVTYDSLEKVTKWLEERGDLKEWKLCVDESHKLVDSAAFRPNAINSVLNNYLKYKSFVFGTATPVKDKYQLPALKHIPKVKIKWNNLAKVNVNYCHYDTNINDVSAILALDFINDERKGNAHIFINSVSSICHIIRKMEKGGFKEYNKIRIVCADNPRNQNLIESKTSNKVFISPVGSEVKKVNFYTSTAFEGCDIYDKEGKNFIITDGSKDCTKIDIVTVLPQIIGRVRDSKYNCTVDLIYTSNTYLTDLTEKEFEINVINNIEEAKKDILEFNGLRPESTNRRNTIENNNNPYLIVDNEELLLNENSWYNEMHNYSTFKKIYYVSKDGTEKTIVDGISNFNGIEYEYKGMGKIQVSGLNKVKLGKTASFKDLCKDCLEVFEEQSSILKSAKIVEIKKNHPLIYEAYYNLGFEKMKALEFRKKDIKDALLVNSNDASFSSKVVKFLDLSVGKWYSVADLKSRLGVVYKKLHTNRTPKGTDIKYWYDITRKNKRINRKTVSGIVVKGCNIKLI